MIRKGRFNKPAAEIAQRYGESVSFDWRLYRHDIAGSIAHAAALARAAIITADEHQQIENGLRAIEKEIERERAWRYGTGEMQEGEIKRKRDRLTLNHDGELMEIVEDDAPVNRRR